MIRTKGEAGTGNVVEATRHTKTVMRAIRNLTVMPERELFSYAKSIGASIDLVREVARTGTLPVVNFAAGGIATPADAALCMQLGCDGVFVGSGIFKSSNPEKYARAIVEAVTHFNDPLKIAEVSTGLGMGMKGENDLNRPGLTSKYASRPIAFIASGGRSRASATGRIVATHLKMGGKPAY